MTRGRVVSSLHASGPLPVLVDTVQVELGEGPCRLGALNLYSLVFRPGVIAGFDLTVIPQPHDPSAPLVQVCSRLAVAR